VKQALLNPRVYGELVFRGEVMPVSLIEPLVTKDEFDALYGLLNDQSRGTKGPKKLDNLLSGIALCGRCADGTKVEATTAETVGGYGPVYRCPKGHNQHPRHEADAVVIGEVLNALEENPHIFDGEAEESVRVELASLRGLLLRWRDGASEMDPEEYLEVTRPLRARLMELEESHRDESLSALFEGLATSYSGMETLISDSLRLAEWWDSIGLLRQRALVSSLLNVTLMPRQRHSPGTHADYVKCRSAQS
jgi:hypothetical protein